MKALLQTKDQRIAELEDALTETKQTLKLERDMVVQLSDALTEAREDTARLDWLEEQAGLPRLVCKLQQTDGWYPTWRVEQSFEDRYWKRTAREALDAARKAGQ